MRFINTLCAIGCVMGLAGYSLAADAAAAPAAREMLKVDPRTHFKVVYDLHSAETAAGISKGLYYARGLIEAYGKQGRRSCTTDIRASSSCRATATHIWAVFEGRSRT